MSNIEDAMMLAYYFGACRQTETKTLRFGCEEWAKESAADLFGDRGAAIGNFKEDHSAGGANRPPRSIFTKIDLDANGALFALLCGFNGILNEVEHNLLHLIGIEPSGEAIPIHLHKKLHISLLGLEN